MDVDAGVDRRGYHCATPKVAGGQMDEVPWMDFSSGYVQRGIGRFPKQGSRKPWKLHQNYALDIMNLRYSPLEDDELKFA